MANDEDVWEGDDAAQSREEELDAMNVVLTLDDVRDMPPEQILQMYEQLRQDRLDLKEDRKYQLERLDERRVQALDERNRMTTICKKLTDEVRSRDTRLAAVAMKMVDLGFLSALTVERNDAE